MMMWNKEERSIGQVDAVLLIYKYVWVCLTEKGHIFIGFDPHPDVKIKDQIFRVDCFPD